MNEFELKNRIDLLEKFAEQQNRVNKALGDMIEGLYKEVAELSDKVYELTPKRKR